MGIFGAVTAFLAIAGAIIGIGKSIYDSEQQEIITDKQNELAEKSLNQNEKVAQQNFDLSKEQFEYQKQLNQLQMDREDSAFQRQVADLQKAGLSPLMVAGNGASSNPLTSASAPQFDMSGINQAFQNMIGSYNDSFNRKLQSRQFALQSKVQNAQLYADLLNSYNQQKKARLEMQYTQEKLNWEKVHGFRDYSWRSELTRVAEQLIESKKSSVISTLGDLKTGLFNSGNGNGLPSVKDYLSGLFTSDEQTFEPLPLNYNQVPSTTQQRKKDLTKLDKELNKDYNQALNIITTRAPTKYNLQDKKYIEAAQYFLKFTEAGKYYDSVYSFVTNELDTEKKRKNINEKYPVKERVILR